MSDVLDEAKRLLEAATPGPWEVPTNPPPLEKRSLVAAHDTILFAIWRESDERHAADAALIARAPTLIAELVAMVRSERERAVRAYGELIAIAHLAAPGRAWPYERVTSFLEKEAADGE